MAKLTILWIWALGTMVGRSVLWIWAWKTIAEQGVLWIWAPLGTIAKLIIPWIRAFAHYG